MRTFFMQTPRVGFSTWGRQDEALAQLLWTDGMVARYICKAGVFTPRQAAERLRAEMENEAKYGVQYWPVFEKDTLEFLGCCGLRPHKAGAGSYELGFHLRSGFWGRGYATEAAAAVMEHAYQRLGAGQLFAGHHPENAASARVLEKLGFCREGAELYPPTGLDHPSYRHRP